MSRNKIDDLAARQRYGSTDALVMPHECGCVDGQYTCATHRPASVSRFWPNVPSAERCHATAATLFASAKRKARGARSKRRTNPDWSAFRLGEARDDLSAAIGWRDVGHTVARERASEDKE